MALREHPIVEDDQRADRQVAVGSCVRRLLERESHRLLSGHRNASCHTPANDPAAQPGRGKNNLP